MPEVLLLDIDGVVCKPQERMTDNMREALKRFNIYYVTGNRYTKAVDLVGGGKIFSCNGYELRESGKLIHREEDDPLSVEIEYHLQYFMLGKTSYGNSIDWRSPSFINFSVIGRFAPWDVRLSHEPVWQDKLKQEIQSKWDVEVSKGAVSVDIYSKGADKSRAARWLNQNGYTFTFIGDKTEPGGNDYPIVEYCRQHPKNKYSTSLGPDHTLELLKEFEYA